MVNAAIALSGRTGVVVQKRPRRKWNAALRKPNAGVQTITINAKPASEPSRDVLKTGPTKLPSKDDSSSKRRKNRQDQIEPISKEDSSSKLPKNRQDQIEPISKEDSSSKLLKDRHEKDQIEPRKNAKMPIIVSKSVVSKRNTNAQLAGLEFELRRMRKVVVDRSNESERIALNARETNNETGIGGNLRIGAMIIDVVINGYNHSAIRTVETKTNNVATTLRGIRFIIVRSRNVFEISA